MSHGHRASDGPASRLLDALSRAAAPLALGVAVLLFAQWPLRDAVGAGSTLANDMAQALFALYVAVAVTQAERRGMHLVARPDLAARGGRWRRLGAALCLLPWALYLVATSVPTVLHALQAWERFPETSNPGYFVVKLALLAVGALLALQAAVMLKAALRR